MAKPEPKEHQIAVRLEDSIVVMLDELVVDLNKHRTEVIREAIRRLHAAVKRKANR